MQSVEDVIVDRKQHVWRRLNKGEGWLCVLCGGVSHTPEDDCTPRKYVPLTEHDRTLCKPRLDKDGEVIPDKAIKVVKTKGRS